MDYVSSACKSDPMKCLEHCIFISRRRLQRKSGAAAADENQFWLHPKFTRWKSQQGPALIMVKGDYKHRFAVRYFCASIIQILRKNNVPVIWALKALDPKMAQSLCAVDLIKNPVCQALRLNISLHTQRSLALSCAQFGAADTPEQWFDLLATVIATLPELYILVDIEAVDTAYANSIHGFSRISAFLAIFQSLHSRQHMIKLKVVLVSYGSTALQETKLAKFKDLVVFPQYCRPLTLRHRVRVPASSRNAVASVVLNRKK